VFNLNKIKHIVPGIIICVIIGKISEFLGEKFSTVGAASFAIFAIPLNIIIKILLVLIISSFFILCTFLKIGEQNFDKFFFYALKYLFRKKHFVYERSLL